MTKSSYFFSKNSQMIYFYTKMWYTIINDWRGINGKTNKKENVGCSFPIFRLYYNHFNRHILANVADCF